MVPEGDWFCKFCAEKRAPEETDKKAGAQNRFFGGLVKKNVGQNPLAYVLDSYLFETNWGLLETTGGAGASTGGSSGAGAGAGGAAAPAGSSVVGSGGSGGSGGAAVGGAASGAEAGGASGMSAADMALHSEIIQSWDVPNFASSRRTAESRRNAYLRKRRKLGTGDYTSVSHAFAGEPIHLNFRNAPLSPASLSTTDLPDAAADGGSAEPRPPTQVRRAPAGPVTANVSVAGVLPTADESYLVPTASEQKEV